MREFDDFEDDEFEEEDDEFIETILIFENEVCDFCKEEKEAVHPFFGQKICDECYTNLRRED
ncbi:hypothetical protein WD019_15415 [Fictibacillus sp. Mic-4]|uniref:hypothetical protein n=1 Tax=Fictibacillus sp. Mic-4 TaxID=3132826 RepID=UPI003CE768AC